MQRPLCGLCRKQTPHKMSQLPLVVLAVLAGSAPPYTSAIINLNQHTADDLVNYMRPKTSPEAVGPAAWSSGTRCLSAYTELYLQLSNRYTRVHNMIITSAFNMSSPAAQIQDGFLKSMNEMISHANSTSTSQKLFQLRVVSDARAYVAPPNARYGELLLADFYVIVVDSLPRFRRLMRNYVSHMRSWNPGATFLVLFNHAQQRFNGERRLAEEIFSEMQDKYFVNAVAVLYALNTTTYSFWLMDYYNSQACRTMQLRRIGECRNGELQPSLPKMKYILMTHFRRVSLENCTFQMCTTISEPFVERDCTSGIELRTLSIIENQLRFDVNHSCSNETRGVIDDEGLWTGLLRKLQQRECDFILGGYFPDNEVLDDFWASDCYLTDAYTWYVKSAEARPRWLALYSIFAERTWLCFILVLLMTWLFWFFVMNAEPEPANFKQFSLAAINSIAVTLCTSVHERPLCNASRLFFWALSLYGMNAVTIYTSKLITVFSNPGHQHQIDSIDEVMASGIPFGGSKENRDWFENDDDMWIYEHYNDSTLFEPQADGLEAVKSGQRVILSSRMYILQSPVSDDVHGFTANVLSSPIQIIVKPGFPFLREINWKIRQMRDAGFFNKIMREFYFNHTVLNRIAKMRPPFQESAIVLTTEHLEGSFAILIVGTLCSVGAFIAELLFAFCLSPLMAQYFSKVAPPASHRVQISEPRMVAPGSRKRRSKLKVLTSNAYTMQGVRFTPIKRRIIMGTKGAKNF